MSGAILFHRRKRILLSFRLQFQNYRIRIPFPFPADFFLIGHIHIMIGDFRFLGQISFNHPQNPFPLFTGHFRLQGMVVILQQYQPRRLAFFRFKPHSGNRRIAHMLLPASDKTGTVYVGKHTGSYFSHDFRACRFHGPRRSSDFQTAVLQPEVLFPGSSQTVPAESELFFVKIISFRYFFHRRFRQIRSRVSPIQFSGSRTHHRPSVFPDYGGYEGFPSHIFVIAAVRPGSQHDHIPAAVLQLHNIRMSRIGDRGSHSQMSVGHDRVSVITLVVPHHFPASGYGHRMEMLGTPFGYHQIIPPVFLIQMRRFRTPCQHLGTAPDFFLFSHKPEIRQVYPADPYLIMAHVLSGTGTGIIGGPILIPEQGRIDPLGPFNPVRFRPGPRRILSGNNEIPAVIHIGGDHIKKPLMIPDRRGENTSRYPVRSQGKLGRPIQHMPDLLPMCQIAAVKNRHSGIKGKG